MRRLDARNRVAECGWHSPPDGAPLHLDLEARPAG